MVLVMFYSGKKLPEYLEYTFRQIRIFNPDVFIYFLTDNELLDNPVFEKYNVIAVLKDIYNSHKLDKFRVLYHHPSDSLWTTAAVRLFYIENFLKAKKFKNVYHFENDIMLYFNLKEHHRTFENLYKTLAITIGGPDKVMTGFFFIKRWIPLSYMTQFFIDTLVRYGYSGTIRRYGMDMINEMTLMRAYEKETGNLENLPILPYGDYSTNYIMFNSIFDPASWGQFVGGLASNKTPGIKLDDHYIGQELTAHPEYTVIWKKDDEGRGIPYFKYDEKEVKINNLHIHCKDLDKYMSL